MMQAVQRLVALDDADMHGLIDVLIDCVDGGASVNFMHPLSRERATRFWQSVRQGVERGANALFVARDELGVCGTVQLQLDVPDNQPHRAELKKMLVHRRARKRGLGGLLLTAAEAAAREMGKTLLVLDTASDDASRLYSRHGWLRAGVIPGYALWPRGGLCDSTYYYRVLAT